MTHIEVKYVEKWPRYKLKCVHMIESIYYYCISSISQPFINGFCFNIGHSNELQLVIRMSEYSVREEVIRIFEYSNHSLETLLMRSDGLGAAV